MQQARQSQNQMTEVTSEKILVIVESPNKVKTISSILKNAGYTYATVAATVGHIITLKDGGPAYNSGIYPNKNFSMNLEIIEDKKKVVTLLSDQAKAVDKIFIMTDDDREGSIIAWSVIKFCKLPQEKCYRAITHEITPAAVVNAIKKPVPFDDNLVQAGLTRMMVDKLIGYGLSPIGKKYIGAKSIGRCQSVGLKLIVDRETEINDFIPELYFDLYLNFTKGANSFKAKYTGYKTEAIDHFTNKADLNAAMSMCKANEYYIEDIQVKKHTESPCAAFCTATFQQEAANKLGLRVKDAMSCAQKLFEGINIDGKHLGLITYMRTDSTDISKEFIPCLKEYVIKHFGSANYVGPRTTKHKSTDQCGHEAIRVTDLSVTPDILSKYTSSKTLLKVYELIWRRTLASVMANATISEKVYIINNNGHKFSFNTKTITNQGYRAVYLAESTPEQSQPVDFQVGDFVENALLEDLKKFTQPKSRYTEASLIRELQQQEIGRPSTYVAIVETILSPSRGYATLEGKHIVPTERGIQLAKYCDRAFPMLINTDYTKSMEVSLDNIASGITDWLEYMKKFYLELDSVIKNTYETGIAQDMPNKQCPVCGSEMVVRRSRFGKLFYGCSKFPMCKGITNLD